MYKDPFHIPSASLVVWHGGKESLVLNKALLDQQLAWHNLDLIKSLHKERFILEDEMYATDDPDLLYLLDKLYTEIEFELQDAWGFERNTKFHKFWQRPKCRCPVMDNEDRWNGSEYRVINSKCPLHGERDKAEVW